MLITEWCLVIGQYVIAEHINRSYGGRCAPNGIGRQARVWQSARTFVPHGLPIESEAGSQLCSRVCAI